MTTKVPNSMLVSPGGGGSSTPTLVTYSTAIPLDGNKYSANHTVSTTETLTLGAYAEGGSYYANFIGDGTHSPVLAAFNIISGSDTFNPATGRINLLNFGYQGGNAYVVVKDTGLTLVVPPVFAAQSAPGGNVGVAYSYMFIATGATSYAVASGTLPAGLTLNTSTGVLNGTPTTAAAYTFVISATNTAGTTNSTTQNVTIAVALPVFTAQSAPAGSLGTAYSYTFVATGAASYAVASGTIPAGLSFNTSTGVLSGTPTTGATYTFVISATNTGGTTNSSSQSVTVGSSSANLRFLTLNTVNETGTGPYNYNLNNGGSAYGANLGNAFGTAGYVQLTLSAQTSTGTGSIFFMSGANTDNNDNDFGIGIELNGINYRPRTGTGTWGTANGTATVTADGDIIRMAVDSTGHWTALVSKDGGATFTLVHTFAGATSVKQYAHIWAYSNTNRYANSVLIAGGT